MSEFLNEQETEEIVKVIVEALETSSKKKVIGMEIISEEEEEEIEMFVQFNDLSVMHSFITVLNIDGQLGCRIRGKYVEVI